MRIRIHTIIALRDNQLYPVREPGPGAVAVPVLQPHPDVIAWDLVDPQGRAQGLELRPRPGLGQEGSPSPLQLSAAVLGGLPLRYGPSFTVSVAAAHGGDPAEPALLARRRCHRAAAAAAGGRGSISTGGVGGGGGGGGGGGSSSSSSTSSRSSTSRSGDCGGGGDRSRDCSRPFKEVPPRLQILLPAASDGDTGEEAPDARHLPEDEGGVGGAF